MNVGTHIAVGFGERAGDRMECAVSPKVIIFAADSRAYLYKNTVQNGNCSKPRVRDCIDRVSVKHSTESLPTQHPYHLSLKNNNGPSSKNYHNSKLKKIFWSAAV